MKLCTLISCLLMIGVSATDPTWHLMHQNDYDVKMDRVLVPWFDTLYFKSLKAELTHYNRTARVLNAFMHLIMKGDELKADLQVYKMLSNEYRYFPVSVSFNVCKEISLNSFGIKDILLQTSNVRECPLKPGFYHIRNAVPDFSRWPPLLPRGEYKLEFKVYNKIDLTAEIHGYLEIVDKPFLKGF